MADIGRVLSPGTAGGELLVLAEPLSLWGGMDPTTGEVIDVHHPQAGVSLAGKIIVMPSGRGSSSSSYVLAEAIRTGVAPAAFLLGEADAIVALGALVGADLYGEEVPVVVLDGETYADLADLAGPASVARVDVRAEPDGSPTVTVVT